MTSQPRDKTHDSTKYDTAKFGLDPHLIVSCHILLTREIMSIAFPF